MNIAGIIGLVLSIIALITAIWKGGSAWTSVKNDVREAREIAERVEKALEKHLKEFKEHVGEFREVARKSEESYMKIGLFWAIVEQQLPHMLTVPRSQNLLEKLRDNTITDEELLYLEREIRKKMPGDAPDRSEVLTRILSLWAVAVRKKERGLC